MTDFNSSLPDDRLPELHALAAASLSGEPSDEEIARLEQLVCEDPKLCKLYVRYMYISWNLKTWAKYPLPDDAEKQPQPLSQDAGVVPLERLTGSVPIGLQNPSRLGFLGSAYHGTAAFFSQELPLAWLITTVIMGVAILGAWAYKITHYQHIAEAPSQSAPSEAMPEMVFVGRITGMVDVKWSDDPRYLPPPDFAHVPLDRKYILDSGLLEITYDSGAKVILEGPCTYEVESTAGGYLALGKLTAKVEAVEGKGSRSKVQGSRSKAEPSSFILHPSSLISVRTPTAVVTDLGTEFGVEVDHSGGTQSHVFRGKVKVAVLADGGNKGARREVILGENESARVERAEGAGQMSIIRCAAGKAPSGFVRAMPRPKPAVTVRIVEKFDGAELGAEFAQTPPGRYVNTGGAAVYQQPPTSNERQSRGYIHTVATDFNDRDFVFEATFEVRLSAIDELLSHYIFFGIGDGVPNANHWDEVSIGLVLAFTVDDGRTFVRLCHPDSKADHSLNKTVGEVTLRGALKPGKYRFRMSKTGKWVRFTVNTECKGPFHADFHGPLIDLPETAPLLNSTNSRLLVGTGNCDTMTVRFEELSVAYTDTAREVQEVIHAGDSRAAVPDGEATAGDNAQQGGRDKTNEK